MSIFRKNNNFFSSMETYLDNIIENNTQIEDICKSTYLDAPVSYAMSATAHFLGHRIHFSSSEQFIHFLHTPNIKSQDIEFLKSDQRSTLRLEEINFTRFNEAVLNNGYIYTKFNHGPLDNLKKIYKSSSPDKVQVARFLKSMNLFISSNALSDINSPVLLGLNLGAGESVHLDENLEPVKKLGGRYQTAYDGLSILKQLKFNNTMIIDAHYVKKMATDNYFSHDWVNNIDRDICLIGPSHFKGCTLRDKKLVYIPCPNVSAVETTLGYFIGLYSTMKNNENINSNKNYTFLFQSAAASLPVMYLIKRYLFPNSNFIDLGRILDLAIPRFAKARTAFNLKTFKRDLFFLQESYQEKCNCMSCK